MSIVHLEEEEEIIKNESNNMCLLLGNAKYSIHQIKPIRSVYRERYSLRIPFKSHLSHNSFYCR